MSLFTRINRNCVYNIIGNVARSRSHRLLCTQTTADEESRSSLNSKGGFARAFDRHNQPVIEESLVEDNQTFASLFRNSKFIDIGDPEGKIVSGRIFHVVEDDLYIDFGWKFHCVCQRPNKNGSDYVQGARVRLRIKELELSTRFLGSAKDLTVLEADCHIFGVISSQSRTQRTEQLN